MTTPATVTWKGGIQDGCVAIIDQTLLPLELRVLELATVEEVWEAIRSLRVRGAPAIGVAAALGLVLGAAGHRGLSSSALLERLSEHADYLATSRPTAVNLFWALNRMQACARAAAAETEVGDLVIERLHAEAEAIRDEDEALCRSIGAHGAALVPENAGILTHCNAGGLATAAYGTALGVIRSAVAAGKRVRVYADETRPLLQGARLTAYELVTEGIDTTLLCDSMAAYAMAQGRIDLCIVGADRIAANGDTANKIGTYSVALAAAAHDIPFYVAAPSSTFDLELDSGAGIPIEERPAEEVTEGFGCRTAPAGVAVYNPAFDVTPARLIRAIITEHGIIHQPSTASVAAHFAAS